MNTKALHQSGFTLVELLIVVIILALLSAIVVPQFAASTDDARSSAADTSLSNLRAALDLYYQQHGEYPGALTAVPTSACGGTSGTGVATGGAGATATTAFLEQLSLYTDADGGACSVADANHRFGPYMKKPQLENEPFGESNALEVIADADLNMGATAGDPGGYKYDSQTGKIIINIAAEAGR
ncbi:MAG: prepilin-type N-terminal cleavage/methylation domain-containing protein [Gammaproteobacteria bacterium]|nr:prepilin-type N-terminal cleavage/methylation domain-containing protein [Gammaproteobacteria bacterium]